jgi:hypothetical protein
MRLMMMDRDAARSDWLGQVKTAPQFHAQGRSGNQADQPQIPCPTRRENQPGFQHFFVS